MYDGLNIGLLKTRNEEDVIEETLVHNLQFVDVCFAIDGSDDNTLDIIKSFDKVQYAEKDKDVYGEDYVEKYSNPAFGCIDWVFKVPLEKIKTWYHNEGWITMLHGDEFYDENPREAIAHYSEEQPDYMSILWEEIYYFVHASQRDTFSYDESKSVTDQIIWRTKGHYEERQFKNIPGIRFDFGQTNKCTPLGISRGWREPGFTIHHYPWRSPERALTRAQDRVASKRQPNYDILLKKGFFLESLADFALTKGIPPEKTSWHNPSWDKVLVRRERHESK